MGKNDLPRTPPIYYDYANSEVSQYQPGAIHCHDNDLVDYFARYLIEEALSVYQFTLPDEWADNYFKFVLLCMGYISVVKTDKFGVIPQGCGLYGYNIFYQPTHAIISNPLLRGNLRPQIGKECTIIKLQPNYCGILDIVYHYAGLMACAAETTTVNLINSKFSYVFFAENKAQAETMKKLYDNFSSGEPATVTDKNLLTDDGKPKWQLFTQNVQQSYIADRSLQTIRRLHEMFCNEIGIPNTNEDKAERLLTDEVNANNIETIAKATMWMEEMKKGMEETNKMFGTNLSVKMREYPQSMIFPLKAGDKTMVGD